MKDNGIDDFIIDLIKKDVPKQQIFLKVQNQFECVEMTARNHYNRIKEILDENKKKLDGNG